MLSPQVLSKGDTYTVLRPDRLTTTEGRTITHLPLTAIRQALPDGDTGVKLVLTDGATRRLQGGNAYAAAAFLTALTAALPEERDPAGSALATTEDSGAVLKVWQVWTGGFLFVAVYTAYVWWTSSAHGGEMGFLGFVGLLGVLVGGMSSLVVVLSVRDRAVLRRRGITVVAARHYHPNGRRASSYKFTDASGNEHTTGYGANRATDEIHVVYDPENTRLHRAVEPLFMTVLKHASGGSVAFGVLALGLWGVLAPYL